MAKFRNNELVEKAYCEIDLILWKATGEIKIKGKPFVAPTITTQTPRGKFEITYTAELFGILEKLGNKKIQVFAYLLDNKDSQNSINTNLREIAQKSKTSLSTTHDTIKILKDAGLLSVKGSVYMLSPRLMIKGNQAREAYLMRKYIETFNTENAQNEGKTANSDD